LKTPSSTYRVQLHAGFNFDAAAAIADYLSALGISHIYCSPYLQTAPGSKHGYDVADFKAVNNELGGAQAHARFCIRLGENGLGQILDIVPNHMSLAGNNPYWRDVLENGATSRYVGYFDIDWQTGEDRLRNKVLLPVLGDQYGVALTKGAIALERSGTRFTVCHDGSNEPIAPVSLARILSLASEDSDFEKLAFLADAFGGLRWHEGEDAREIRKHRRNQAVLMSMLDEYLRQEPGVLDAVDNAIADINRDADALDALLQEQNYRLAYWRAADQDLGYRRFFDVNSLIGIHVESEEVFLDTHGLILSWLHEGVLDGVRADHADGLRDPQRYFERLREHAPKAYIVAEKILARNETLPKGWPVDGTTGYEFLNLMNGLLVSPEGLEELGTSYERILGHPSDYPSLVHEKKITVTSEALGSDVNWLASIFIEICEADRDHRDFTRADIRHAIREVAASFQVYRSYVQPDRDQLHEMDAAVIQSAVDVAAQYRQDIDRGLFDFLADVLLLRKRGKLESEFLLRFQQFTSPVMAKGLEDTALYCYNRLIGLNDVGSNLNDPCMSIEEFHRYNSRIQQHHPLTMLTLTTHDTKRGEDVRARLLVLSEEPAEFSEAADRCFKMNRVHRTNNLPDANTEYFYYQTLIGAWPIEEDRALAYMTKATREAKEQTSWVHNNKQFEDALGGFIHCTLSDEVFRSEIQAFVEKIDMAGRLNSLSQTLLKCTCPGVPDLYQGSELWDHRLVDPDNRTPVDYEVRRRLLNELASLSIPQILDRMHEGLPKLWTIQRALAVRNQHPQCFDRNATYSPIVVEGSKCNHVVAFLRGDRVAVIVPRLTQAIDGDWQQTRVTLPDGTWTNRLSDSIVPGGKNEVSDLFKQFPIALLAKEN